MPLYIVRPHRVCWHRKAYQCVEAVLPHFRGLEESRNTGKYRKDLNFLKFLYICVQS